MSRFSRLHRDRQSPTLRAGTLDDHGAHTAARPIHYRYPRCITVREAARLHSLPDWFRLDPTKWRGYMQVGNSVPPRLARVVARSIRAAIVRSRTEPVEPRRLRRPRPGHDANPARARGWSPVRNEGDDLAGPPPR